VTRSQGDRGGKFAFTVPDVTGDGLEELAVVGRYGMGFGVLDSGSDLPGQKLRYLVSHSLTGHSSPNNQLIQYYDGAVVRTTDDAKRWLGVVALNPGGINYFAAPDFKPVWGHFTHTTVHSHCLCDLNADGAPEVLVGREDGYVIQYAVADGSVVNQAYAGGEVRALAASGKRVVAGTTEGFVLFDDQLRAVGFRPGAVQALKALKSSAAGIELLAAALENGHVAALRLREDGRR